MPCINHVNQSWSDGPKATAACLYILIISSHEMSKYTFMDLLFLLYFTHFTMTDLPMEYKRC